MSGTSNRETVSEFQKRREAQNEILTKYAGLGMKRFLSLDTQLYREGELPAKMKELLGLTASLVLRCDDCILYHLVRCREEGVSDGELEETLSIGLLVGGSIVIPHLRRALEHWDEMKNATL